MEDTKIPIEVYYDDSVWGEVIIKNYTDKYYEIQKKVAKAIENYKKIQFTVFTLDMLSFISIISCIYIKYIPGQIICSIVFIISALLSLKIINNAFYQEDENFPHLDKKKIIPLGITFEEYKVYKDYSLSEYLEKNCGLYPHLKNAIRRQGILSVSIQNSDIGSDYCNLSFEIESESKIVDKINLKEILAIRTTREEFKGKIQLNDTKGLCIIYSYYDKLLLDYRYTNIQYRKAGAKNMEVKYEKI